MVEEKSLEKNYVKKALITGITGQDGSYLAELLLGKGYEVHGLIRRSSSFNTKRIEHIYEDSHDAKARLFLHYGDMTDGSCLARLVGSILPDEIYNLAAQSHVKVSFGMPEYTAKVDALGTLSLLDAIILSKRIKKTRFYQASTSEMFGGSQEEKQDENTPFQPRSPYAIAKLFAHWTVINHRQAYGIHASNGILFNHESPRRGETFVTRKITRGVASIKLGLQKRLYLGNLEAKRDWGHAKDYVKMMWLMLQQEEPDDYVIATGESHTVREFAEKAFKVVGIDLEWKGEGISEKGIDRKTNETIVEIDEKYFRPTEVKFLCGSAEKAKRVLGWKNNYSFDELVTEMVLADYKNMSKGVTER